MSFAFKWYYLFSSFPFFPLIKFSSVFLHEFIQLIKVYVCQDRADNSALRCSAVGVMKVPVFDISCIQKFSNQANKSFVSDTFFQNTYQYLMIDIVENPLISPSTNHFTPENVFWISDKAVWQLLRGRKPCDVFQTVFHRWLPISFWPLPAIIYH